MLMNNPEQLPDGRCVLLISLPCDVAEVLEREAKDRGMTMEELLAEKLLFYS